MTDSRLAVVVLAAGKGTRMKSDLPKVAHKLAGKAMLHHVLDAIAALDPAKLVVVVGPDMALVEDLARPHQTVVQAPQAGTGHAVLMARDALAAFQAPGHDLLVAFGDTPLITAQTFAALLEARRGPAAPALVLLGFRPGDPTGYGRIKLDPERRPVGIVEERDASDAERRIGLCNGGLMLGDAGVMFELLDRVGNDNAKGEYYLTDIAALAHAAGYATAVVETSEDEIMGINSRDELAVAEAVMQTRLRGEAMAAGTTLTDPTTVWLSADTRFGRDVVVHPNVFFGPGVRVGDRAEIRSFCHLEGAAIGADAIIGPFARLRPGTVLGPEAHIGNFVEIKNAVLDQGAKANHLAYVGDADIGARANIGAGTITCNYDGFAKHRTVVGAGAFIGTNTALVAPVTVGEDAITGAGSVITEDVPARDLAVTRARQENINQGAARYRAKRQNEEGGAETGTAHNKNAGADRESPSRTAIRQRG